MTNYIAPTTTFTAKREDFEQKKFNENGQISGSGSGPYDKNIYDLEKNLIIAINNFYEKYAEFIRCGTSDDTADTYDQEYKRSNYQGSLDNRICKNPPISKSTVDTLQGIVKDKANALTLALTKVTSLNRTDYSNTMNNFNKGHQELLNKYSNNLNLRNELDLKMKEILKTDDSFVNQSKLHYDSTMYASIGWTILATSLLYYVFRKL